MEMKHDDTDMLNTMLDLEPPWSKNLPTPMFMVNFTEKIDFYCTYVLC